MGGGWSSLAARAVKCGVSRAARVTAVDISCVLATCQLQSTCYDFVRNLSCMHMAGVCCKSTAPLSVFKRTLSVRNSASAPRSAPVVCGRRGAVLARPLHLHTVSPHRHPTQLFCSSFVQESMSESLRACYVYLNQTSRSFAAVIQALDGELR